MTFSELALYLQKLEKTPSRNEMTKILADLFGHASRDEIGKICYLTQGRVAPLYEAIEFGLADKFMIRAISEAYGVDQKSVIHEFKKAGDLGIAAEVLYRGKDRRLSVSEVFARLSLIAATGGAGSQEKKISLIADIFQAVSALSARYIARIPLDKLRLGFSDMTILDALSWMIAGDKSLRSELEASYNIRPDIGLLAATVKTHGVKGLRSVRTKVGAPILAALCQRLPTADEMIKKMGTVDVEPKYDGVRVQIHYQAQNSSQTNLKTQSFSRNLENTTAMFPELGEIGGQLHAQEVVLDSEAAGVDPKTGRLIPFQETMTRKRKHNIGRARSSVPLRFFVFDILFKDGQDLLGRPLSERRKILEETIRPGKLLVISPHIVTGSAMEIRQYHDEQLKKGLEGAVVKKWNSPYEPGRRGYSWVKFKQEEGKTGKLTDTIDCVVMGYTSGQGKRASFGIGQVLLGVKKGESFVTLTKMGSGATEEELGELAKKLKKLRVKSQPKEYQSVNKIYTPDAWVAPGVVLEIAGDDLTKSPAHGAGFAVRFPRLVGIRTDKSPSEATTIAEIEHMYTSQASRQ